MFLTRLDVENFKRLSAVELVFSPEGGLIEVCGDNAQGKSSALDAIWAALGGARAAPLQPIQKGRRSASVTLDVGDMTVTRKWTAQGSTLSVVDADGNPRRSPQTILDGLFNALGFDPLAFLKESAAKQSDTLRRLVGLDFSDLDVARKTASDERAQTNREVKALVARVAAAPFHPGAPSEETSLAQLSAQLRAGIETTQRNDAYRASGAKHAKAVSDGLRLQADLVRRIGELEETLAVVMDNLEKAREAHADFETKVVGVVDPDTAELARRIEQSEADNRKARENAARSRLADELRAARARAEDLSDRIEELDAQRTGRLKEARFPVPGLSLDGDDVTFRGVPLAQASMAEQITVCLAISGALNPDLRVILVREGSFLDVGNLAVVASWAEEHGYQVLMERVQSGLNGAKQGVLIVGGRVAERRLAGVAHEEEAPF